MKIKWNEYRIRQELKRLDTKTGLHGATLPIHFSNTKCLLGQYNALEMSFKFSNFYFQDEDWPVEEAFDVIRHEYAHYMSHMIFGEKGLGHNKYWRKCCNDVGANPTRCYNSERSEYHKKKHEEEEKACVKIDNYKVGDTIIHPKFGNGIIREVFGEKINRSANVDFGDFGAKRLGLKWVDDNCKKCD